MYRFILFLSLAFIVCLSCSPDIVQTASTPTLTGSIQVPNVDISSTLAVLPSNPNINSSQIVLQFFFEAYNRHDVARVLDTVAETFAYGDCDFAERQMLVFETKPDLTIWLQRKFAEQDRFQVIEMIIASPEGSPANDPRSTAVQVLRTNKVLKGKDKQSLFKIILNDEGNRVQYLNTYGNVDCETGR